MVRGHPAGFQTNMGDQPSMGWFMARGLGFRGRPTFSGAYRGHIGEKEKKLNTTIVY